MSDLQFDEERHIYTRDGKILPSVTQIIKPIIEYSDAIPADVMEYASQRGKAAHKACEIIDIGGTFAEELDPVIVPYVDAWNLFVKEKRVTITQTEQHLDHKVMHYAGTFDAVGMIGNDEWLIDRKCIAQLHPAVGIQLAGYEGLLGRKVRRAAVQLKPDGKYVFQEYTGRSDWPVFVSLLTVHNWRSNNGKHTHV
jgi:hypothetical protein